MEWTKSQINAARLPPLYAAHPHLQLLCPVFYEFSGRAGREQDFPVRIKRNKPQQPSSWYDKQRKHLGAIYIYTQQFGIQLKETKQKINNNNNNKTNMSQNWCM